MTEDSPRWTGGFSTDISDDIQGRFGGLQGNARVDSFDINSNSVSLATNLTGNNTINKSGNGVLQVGNGGTRSNIAGNLALLDVNELGENQLNNAQTPNNYSGALFGRGGFTKAGAGALTLSGTNTYSGVTEVNAGTLQINTGGTLTKEGGGTLILSGTNTYNGTTLPPPNDVNGLTKPGITDWVLEANNTYTGATTVSGGTLFPTGTASTTLTYGGTLSGNRAGAGALALDDKALFGSAPGGSDTAQLSTLSSNRQFTLGNGTLNAGQAFTGNVTLQDGPLSVAPGGYAPGVRTESGQQIAQVVFLNPTVQPPAPLPALEADMPAQTESAPRYAAAMTEDSNERKARSIFIPRVNISTPTPLDQVIDTLHTLSVRYDPDEKGLNFFTYPPTSNEPMPKVALPDLNGLSIQDLLRVIAEKTGYTFTSDGPIIVLRPAGEAPAKPESDTPAPRPPSEVKFPAPVATADNAFSTFALNVNDSSYQLARAALFNHRWPDPAATRTEEFLNAFQYHDPAPATGEACTLHYDLGQNPIESGDLLRVSFQTAAAGRDRTTPLRLTILLDDSGSMTRADRTATVQAALRALAGQLRAGDLVSLVTFARTPQVRATAVPAERFGEILDLAKSIEPEGGTNMEEALRTAYATARSLYDEHAQNRVILLTDGAANLGELDPAAL
ncbi:MAG TPA: von Willebrand factor type A domain-containing protein, partial [Verrucomicrobiae bacterium]|nr:von Willebrand factor type A domain-containing protein [Verrucomicrobiae bacterium]